MKPDLATALDRFMFKVRGRLERGSVDLEDRNLDAELAALLNEIMEELEDVAGWSVLLWHRLDRLRGALLRLEKETS